MRRALAVGLLLVAAVACGEPDIDVTLPERGEGEHVADLAGVLDGEALEARLSDVRDAGTDIVALTYETEQAGCGEAYRAAQRFVDEWDADVAVVAVARPGDFTATDDDRQRCVGVQPRDDRAVAGDLRERIAEELVPPRAAENDWDGAFTVAVEELAS